MKSRIWLLILIPLLLGGCSWLKVPEEKPTVKKETTKTTSARQVKKAPIEFEEPSPGEESYSKGIRVETIPVLTVNAGDKNGIVIGENIKAIHLCTGEPVKTFTFSDPRWGSIKLFPNNECRYFPPDFPTEDSLKIRLTADDGCSASVNQIIQVVKPEISAPEIQTKNVPVKLIITSPKSGARNPDRVCNISGKAIGVPSGTQLDIIVVNIWGISYIQDCHPVVSEGRFDGWVFLGDEYGHGIGENFKIYVQDAAGHKSRPITVMRTR